jgi:pimeloyl-ACP methyl ester carboxylesterase
MRRTQKKIASHGAGICTEAFGEPGDPAILLIMGNMASMLWWPDELCERLAERARFVIRYDNRDTGLSTSYEPGKPAYTLDDLGDDAVAVLDGHGVGRAQVVGMSLGGLIAQFVAREHPERVAGVVAISTTPLGATDLPDPDPAYSEHAAAAFEGVDWSDRRTLIEPIVEDARQLAGSRHPFDEAAARDLVTRDLERTLSPQSLVNHGLLTAGERWQDGGRAIDAPFVVIHGTADPLFPYPHGEALANAVPGAVLVTVEGGGHELHERDWDQILDAVLGHARRA